MGDLRDLLLRATIGAVGSAVRARGRLRSIPGADDAIRDGMARAAKVRSSLLPAEELAGPSGLAVFAEDRLLRALLESAPICDVALERFATSLRLSLLTAAGFAADRAVAEPVLGFCCATRTPVLHQ